MNYIKWALYAVFATILLYVIVPPGGIFISTFFTQTGFIVTILFLMAEIYTAAYSLDFAEKDKKAAE